MLGCETGRSSDQWINFYFWGHQVVAHLSPDEAGKSSMNEVDGHSVPTKHFGLILEWKQWEELAERLQEKVISFIIEPYIRFEGQSGEQSTMFF